MRHISPLDVAWLFVESDETPMHVGCLQIFSPPAEASENFVEEMVDGLSLSRQFAPPFSLRMRSRRLALPQWEETSDLDLEYHLQRWALPPPGEATALHELVAQIHSQPLDTARPLWEFHFIEGLTQGRFALFVKVHHSLMDGIGGIRLLQNLFSHSAASGALVPPWAPRAEEPRTPGTGLETVAPQHPIVRRARALMAQLEALPNATENLASLAWSAIRPQGSDLKAPYTAPRCVLNERVSSRRQFTTCRLPLAQLQALARRTDSTVNDVFLAVCSGALRRYLLERGELPQQALIAGLPVSVRPEGDTQVGTAISFVVADLATHHADPRQRLEAIHASTQAAKQHLSSLSHEAQTEYTLLLMAPFMFELMSGLAGRLRPAFNLIISNVPGPRDALYFHGAQLESLTPSSIVTHGQALNITAVSYCGNLDIGFTACAERVPELESLAIYTRQALDELEDAFPKSAD